MLHRRGRKPFGRQLTIRCIHHHVSRLHPPARARLFARLIDACLDAKDRCQLDEGARLPPAAVVESEGWQCDRCGARLPPGPPPQRRGIASPITFARPAAATAPLLPICLAPCTPSACYPATPSVHRLCARLRRVHDEALDYEQAPGGYRCPLFELHTPVYANLPVPMFCPCRLRARVRSRCASAWRRVEPLIG